MVASQFESILKDFEPYFNCKLEPDSNNSCLLQMESGVGVQIELTAYGLLLIGIRLGTPTGAYQHQIFKEALKANHLHPPSKGVFGYSKKSGHLILFLFEDPNELNPDKATALITPLIAKALMWSQAIQKAELPSTETTDSETPLFP